MVVTCIALVIGENKMNVRQFLEGKVSKNPDKIFLYFQDQEITYKDFNASVNRVANGLLHLGVKKGDRVCLMLPNCPEFLYSWFGCQKIGAVMVPINTAFKGPETKYIVNHSEANTLIVDSPFLEVIQAIRGECASLERVICLGEQPTPGGMLFSELCQVAAPELAEITIADDDMASIVYTSGTTGLPKGVIHTQRSYVLAGEAFLKRAPVTAQDHLLICLPLFHVNAQFYSTMGCLAAEANLILVERFSASRFWEQTRHYGATQFSFVGIIGKILYNRPQTDGDADNPVRIVNSGGMPKDILEGFEKRFGVTVIEGYGLTEFPLVCQNPFDGLRKTGSIGLPSKHPDPKMKFTEMKVVDENAQELPAGKIGELILRGPLMMKGYFKDAEKTAEAIRDGWLHTGDYAYMDEDGYFYFVDRKKDVIRRRGENVSPAEVEGVINQHPKVEASAVIPVPAELGEDDIKAYVELKTGEELAPEEIVRWCQERLAYFKVPRYIEFRRELPKTGTERIAKQLLKQERAVLSEGCFDREAKKNSLPQK